MILRIFLNPSYLGVLIHHIVKAGFVLIKMYHIQIMLIISNIKVMDLNDLKQIMDLIIQY